MASSQEIDQFFTLANALLLKLRIAESYATRPHELTFVGTFEGGEEMAITQAQTRLVDRRTALAELEVEIRTNLDEIRTQFMGLRTEFGASLKALDGFKPTGRTVGFEALQSATYDVLRWIGETFAWLQLANRIPVAMNPQAWRKCDATADSFPLTSISEAEIRKQLWFETATLTKRAESDSPTATAHKTPVVGSHPLSPFKEKWPREEYARNAIIRLKENPELQGNISDFCRTIAGEQGIPEIAISLKKMLYQSEYKNLWKTAK